MRNQYLAIDKNWLKLVDCYRKLSEFGFIESHPVNQIERLKEVRFSSRNFIFVVGTDLLLNERYGQTLDAETGVVVPEPELALCYFLPDIDAFIKKHEAAKDIEQEFEVKLNLYRENPWVIQSKAWAFNQEFLDAIKKTDQWVSKEMRGGIRPLQRWEFERVLHSYRNPKTKIPIEPT